jgi:hypothetical protein
MEEIEKLKEDNKHLVCSLAASEARNEELHDQVNRAKRGGNCDGEYCAHCKHGIKGEPVVLRNARGYAIGYKDGEIYCDINVICTDFQRKEE